MALRIHALCLALNEEPFIGELLKTLYPFCSGISVLSQYDRDYEGNRVVPDQTVAQVLGFPDPEGKLQLVIRRWRDQAPALNSELLALAARPARRTQSLPHMSDAVRAFHEPPDYVLVVDADEIYDVDTFGSILAYLEQRRPRGMRVLGYNYLRTWNRRAPKEVVYFRQFGFVRPGVLFEQHRIASWNQLRLARLLGMLHLPDISARLYGFIDCPEEVGVFHHGCWLGDDVRLAAKLRKNVSTYRSHKDPPAYWQTEHYLERVHTVQTEYVPTEQLPRNIREGNWPAQFFEPMGAEAAG